MEEKPIEGDGKKEILVQNNENKEHHFIYFIESHEKTKEIKVYLSPNYKDSDTLEMIEQKDSSNIKNSLISNIYRFKIYPDNYEPNKKEENVTLIMEDKSNKSEYIIKINDIHMDFYDYNLRMNKIDIFKLSYEQQFQIYIDYLRKKLNIKQNSKENDEFIISTHLLIENQKYDFLFYLLILLECFTQKIGYKHLLIFKPENIRGLGEVPDIKIKQINNILSMLYKKPEKIKIEKEEERKQINESLNFIILYFNLNYQQEKLSELLANEKMYENLIKKQNYFNNIILSNDLVKILIEKAKNFDQVLVLLFYLGKDSVNVLEIICEKKEKIIELISKIEDKNDINEDEKEVIKFIEFEKYVIPKSEDNLFKMLEFINKINIYEATNFKIVKFSPETFNEYVNYNKDSNLENLKYINQIIISIKKIDIKFKFALKLDNIIHETALNLIGKKKFNNKQIIDFINTDDFYQNSKYKTNKNYRPLTVFNGINILALDDEFFKEWKKINFFVMFDSQFKEFAAKIASLINEMKDFGKLFKLYNVDISIDTKIAYVEELKKRFFELLDTYSKENCPKFLEDTAIILIQTSKIDRRVWR